MRRTLPYRSGRRAAAGAAATLLATLAALVMPAGPASAHVTVSSTGATQGGYGKLTFRVPNEKDTASTTKVEVALPTDSPIASVSVRPTVGWTVQADRAKLATPVKTDDGELTEAVTRITWTASPDAAIKPGQFQEFDVSVGPLPEQDQLIFKALQTYSDGDIVRWIEEPTAGAEAEHPAPVLKLPKPAGGASPAPAAAGGAGPPSAPAGDATREAATDEGSSDQTLPIALAIAGLIAGLAGLAAGLLAYRRSATPKI